VAPVMGEMHFARFPEAYWEEEILKMKAGESTLFPRTSSGSTTEEIQGQFDWSGQRNLRRFVELCHQHGMYVWIRVGPWDHGEVRNGAFPTGSSIRRSARTTPPISPLYAASTARSGPVERVDVQRWRPRHRRADRKRIHSRGPGKGEEHILTLRQMAVDAGLQAPFYTITGWDNAAAPARDVLRSSADIPTPSGIARS